MHLITRVDKLCQVMSHEAKIGGIGILKKNITIYENGLVSLHFETVATIQNFRLFILLTCIKNM